MENENEEFQKSIIKSDRNIEGDEIFDNDVNILKNNDIKDKTDWKQKIVRNNSYEEEIVKKKKINLEESQTIIEKFDLKIIIQKNKEEIQNEKQIEIKDTELDEQIIDMNLKIPNYEFLFKKHKKIRNIFLFSNLFSILIFVLPLIINTLNRKYFEFNNDNKLTLFYIFIACFLLNIIPHVLSIIKNQLFKNFLNIIFIIISSILLTGSFFIFNINFVNINIEIFIIQILIVHVIKIFIWLLFWKNNLRKILIIPIIPILFINMIICTIIYSQDINEFQNRYWTILMFIYIIIYSLVIKMKEENVLKENFCITDYNLFLSMYISIRYSIDIIYYPFHLLIIIFIYLINLFRNNKIRTDFFINMKLNWDN